MAKAPSPPNGQHSQMSPRYLTYLSVEDVGQLERKDGAYELRGARVEAVAIMGRAVTFQTRGLEMVLIARESEHGAVLLGRHLATTRHCPFCPDASRDPAALDAIARAAAATGALAVLKREFSVDDATGTVRCSHTCAACAALSPLPEGDGGFKNALVGVRAEPLTRFGGDFFLAAHTLRICDESEVALWWLRRHRRRRDSQVGATTITT